MPFIFNVASLGIAVVSEKDWPLKIDAIHISSTLRSFQKLPYPIFVLDFVCEKLWLYLSFELLSNGYFHNFEFLNNKRETLRILDMRGLPKL